MGWLDEQLRSGVKLTEWEAAEELTHYREENIHYWGLAYENISASGANAGALFHPHRACSADRWRLTCLRCIALPHYSAAEDTAAIIDTTTPYLKYVLLPSLIFGVREFIFPIHSDSGGQYYDGTCDTTRTLHFGFPTDEQMEAYTRVLQGHVRLSPPTPSFSDIRTDLLSDACFRLQSTPRSSLRGQADTSSTSWQGRRYGRMGKLILILEMDAGLLTSLLFLG
jgi:hypothetical protein